MLSEAAQRRLQQLNRGSLDFGTRLRWHHSGDKTPLALETPARIHRPWPAEILSLAGPGDERHALPLGSEETSEHGTFWRIQIRLEVPSSRPERTLLPANVARNVPGKKQRRSDRLDRDFHAFQQVFPQHTLFLDLETCGFAGSAVFLIGLLRATADGWVLEQWLARDYSEERALFARLWRLVAAYPLLATFNGKSFDWPTVHDRSTFFGFGHRVRELASPYPRQMESALRRRDPRPEPLHVDLLHQSRRRWRNVLPNCKLTTLERYVCGRVRASDIPGSRIPEAYHHYVRTGDVGEIREILLHNAMDLLTLVEIARQMMPSQSTTEPIQRRA